MLEFTKATKLTGKVSVTGGTLKLGAKATLDSASLTGADGVIEFAKGGEITKLTGDGNNGTVVSTGTGNTLTLGGSFGGTLDVVGTLAAER